MGPELTVLTLTEFIFPLIFIASFSIPRFPSFSPHTPLLSLTLFCTGEISWQVQTHVAQMIKHLPSMQETWVRSLGWGDPLEKEMATHSSTLAWKIPWMVEPVRLQSLALQKVGYD